MLRLVISQPMFLPWRGIFEQIRLSDHFVFYDDVQLPLGGGRGRGYTTRVQIKTEHGIDWLTVPVVRAGKGSQLIHEARFSDAGWRASHLSKLRQAYRRSPHFASVFETVVQPIYALETDSLATFCMASTRLLCEKLALRPQIHVSSQMAVPRDIGASERVLAFCHTLGASDYISGLGAMNYLDYSLFESAGVRVHYMQYQNLPHPQLHGPFTPYVSILDALFNLGEQATAALLVSPCRYWKDWPLDANGRPTAAAH